MTGPGGIVPVMDVIFLSKASTAALQRMTQDAITSCVLGCYRGQVNVIVMEQVEGIDYRGARTIHAPEEFAYNRFANLAAKEGSAEWIMVANNDLLFEPGWLQPLLDAGNPVVSPINPLSRWQRGFRANARGWQIGRHFSGWCFAIKRTLWEHIGGFDEDFSFWCADDAVVMQVRQAGVIPMIVPTSRVRHLVSVTHRQTPDTDDSRTWAQVHKFETKYGQVKFPDNRNYQAWKDKRGLANG